MTQNDQEETGLPVPARVIPIYVMGSGLAGAHTALLLVGADPL
jgi:hypothetical protein